MKTKSTMALGLLAVGLALGAGSCSTSGGKQDVALNHTTADRDLKGSVSDVSNRAQDVFKDMGITITGTQTKDSGKEQDLTGQAGDKNVSVAMRDLGDGMTHVQVGAKEGTFQWNQDYAQSVLSKIIAKS